MKQILHLVLKKMSQQVAKEQQFTKMLSGFQTQKRQTAKKKYSGLENLKNVL